MDKQNQFRPKDNPGDTEFFMKFLVVNRDILEELRASTYDGNHRKLCDLQIAAGENLKEILQQSVVIPMLEIYLKEKEKN